MRKLTATFYYRGSAEDLIYRKVLVLATSERKLSGNEVNRGDTAHALPEYKTYRLEDCQALHIRFEMLADVKSVKSVPDQLRDLANTLEGATN